MRKLIIAAVITASLAAPASAYAGFGPKSWSFCDVAEWLGFEFYPDCHTEF